MDEFQKARLKLTGLYILISILLLAASTLAAIRAEHAAFSRIQTVFDNPVERPHLTAFLEIRIRNFENNFRKSLFTLDLFLLVVAAGGSYYLSGKTLEPIQKMMKRQEDFAADASHELRTPLSSIGMEIEAVERTEKNLPKSFKEVLISIKEEVSRMKNIVDGLLLFVRSGSDGKKSYEKFQLGKIVKEAFRQMEHLAKDKNVSMNLDLKDELNIFGDKEEIKQVALILLDNAIKYTPERGKVKVTLSRRNDEVHFSVSDAGVGISEKDLRHVFERFYRVHQEDKNFQKGTGLGLSIAKKIVENHRGKITAVSRIGHGSTFTVHLPFS